MLRFEDDGEGMSTQALSEAMDLAPDESVGPPLISYFGEGMKMAVTSLVQETGMVLFFSKQDATWTVVALHKGARGQLQHYSLAMPAYRMPMTERALESWYTEHGWPSPHEAIKKFCKLPGTTRGSRCNGYQHSPYSELSDIYQVGSP